MGEEGEEYLQKVTHRKSLRITERLQRQAVNMAQGKKWKKFGINSLKWA